MLGRVTFAVQDEISTWASYNVDKSSAALELGTEISCERMECKAKLTNLRSSTNNAFVQRDVELEAISKEEVEIITPN